MDHQGASKEPGRSEEVSARIFAARESWIERLIDLTRRNALLFFRRSARRNVEWDGVGSETIADLLAGRAVSLTRIQTLSNDTKAAAKAKEIRKIATAYREERGLETLFLALGLATWTDPAISASGSRFARWGEKAARETDVPLTQKDEPEARTESVQAEKREEPRPPAAPVLLLPISLETKSPTGGGEVHLRRSGDVQVNPVLLFALESTFGLRLTPDDLLIASGENDQVLEDPSGTAAIIRAIEQLRRAASKVQGFDVADRCVLSNFHFQKMAMVRDLRECGELIEANDVIAAIVGDLEARAKLAADRSTGDPRALDSVPPKDQFLVLDADASQHLVIHNVVNSDTASGVIHGPPGTGKSQTITNLIATLVARGKRVLFVAEKRAALDVVLDRLEAVGLDHLALDLHGAEISRASVVERLRNSYEIARRAPEPQSENFFERLSEVGLVLNKHSARINELRPSIGLSLFTIEGEILGLQASAASDVRWRGNELGELTPEKAERARRLLDEAATFGSLFLRDGSSSWYRAKFVDGLQVQRVVDLVADLKNTLLPRLNEALNEFCYAHQFKVPATINDLESQLAAAREVNRVLAAYKPALFDENLDALEATLRPARHGVARMWATLSDPRYRQAVRTVRGHRLSKAAPRVLHEETRSAQSARWKWAARCNETGVFQTETTAIQKALMPVIEALDFLEIVVNQPSLKSIPLTELVALVNSLKESQNDAGRMLRVTQIESELRDLGAFRIVEDIRARPQTAKHWPNRFRYAWLASHREAIFARESELSGFNGDFHEKLVREFGDLDRAQFALAVHRLRSLHGDRTIKAMNTYAQQAALVQKEMSKKTRHIALRKLMDEAEDVVLTICPCWMASPLSVSQLLGQKRYFDIVIFDEASQILPQDAVPALMRSSRAIVAGDEHQLPPTTFFLGVDDDDDDSEEADENIAAGAAASRGMESILAQMQAFLTPWWLQWHYRSRDERLIAFSNRYIYRDSLVTFPGVGLEDPVRHVLIGGPVRDGEENSVGAEVDRVVELIMDHAQNRPYQSLGVITMGITHQRRVEAVLDSARALRPDLDEFFDENEREKFFVKNLERVQGDERDAIILSIGYGKDRSGKLPYRFGPLLTDGGHRRLNVAVTRAKSSITAVSSFSDADMDPERSKARGVELLRLYLQFARSGGSNLATGEGLKHIPLNPFEADIADALEKAGVPLFAQWGVSNYRIDLVAKHPLKPGRLVLAIECDGAGYHSTPTARDRDRLRQQHLEALGWRFHRIWSTDWFLRRENEIDKAKQAYEEAVRNADATDDGQELSAAESRNTLTPFVVPNGPSQAVARGPLPVPQWYGTIDEYSPEQLIAVLRWVESDGLRRTRQELVKQAAHSLGFGRIGSKIRERLERACLALEARRKL